jgi:hypothetical protein
MRKFNLALIDAFIADVDVMLGDKVDERVAQLNLILDTVFGPDNGEMPDAAAYGEWGFTRIATDIEWAQALLFDAIKEEIGEVVTTTPVENLPTDIAYRRLQEVEMMIDNLHDDGAGITNERDCYETEAEWRAALDMVSAALIPLNEEKKAILRAHPYLDV